MRLRWVVVAGICWAIGRGGFTTFAEPNEEHRELIERVRDSYRAIERVVIEYRIVQTIMGENHASFAEISGQIAFRRGEALDAWWEKKCGLGPSEVGIAPRLEYESDCRTGDLITTMRDCWEDEVVSRETERDVKLGMFFASVTGTFGFYPGFIPSLLMPLIAHPLFDHRAEYSVVSSDGEFADDHVVMTMLVPAGSVITVWIDRQTHLIHKIVENDKPFSPNGSCQVTDLKYSELKSR